MIEIPVSIGEILDKLSILEIKMSKLHSSDIRLLVVKREYTMLYDKIIDILPTHEKLYSLLFNINSKLWEIEDNIRSKENNKIFDDEFIRLARSVYIENDERARIKREINVAAESMIMEIKIHPTY